MNNKFYKTSNLIPKDERERIYFLTNEYGYNIDSTKRRKDNNEDMYLKPRNIINKDFITKNL